MNQKQIDDAVRQAKGKTAVEEMVHEDGFCQLYLLSSGEFVEVSKATGQTWLTSKAQALRQAKSAGNRILAAKISNR
jgi:hypothetical protein